uniref:EF-hand domain-containing protein n=1 Tax=Haptolina brevifila TaxID=156173 RepID=A0A7S2CM74_9EUKA|mmetsp:Transcript_25675/g.51547  ORF Transcript_25675/g.51547 Transcript_25675/m.51547 type:complete len:115 (+) Transcript_25675:193-537(+)
MIRFDQNGDGKISITELVRAIGSEKEVANLESAALLIQQARARKRLRNPQAGDKLYYTGHPEEYRNGSKLIPNTCGEVVGPTQSGLHLRMKFSYNKVQGDRYSMVNVYYTLLRR